ncbi:MAG: hypothetical protein K2O03_12335, partial [Lachnospiraceae bacterium]|nr:hypothetical protein [Lachnospiraceae bacterium]
AGVEERLEERITGVETQLKNEINGIKMHLENVTDKNIQTIAEGHLDLNRKLDEALKVEQEKEMLVIRVRVLEEDVQKIKEKLGESA